MVSLSPPFATTHHSLWRFDPFQKYLQFGTNGEARSGPQAEELGGGEKKRKKIKAQNYLSLLVLLQVIGVSNEFHTHVRQDFFFSFLSSEQTLQEREAVNDADGPAQVPSLKP